MSKKMQQKPMKMHRSEFCQTKDREDKQPLRAKREQERTDNQTTSRGTKIKREQNQLEWMKK